MNASSTIAGTISCLENTFLRNIARTSGQSNTDILSQDTEAAIHNVLPQIQEELDELDQEIAKLQAKRSKIVDLVHSLDVARAAHKRLPLDVLTHIFSMVAEGSRMSASNLRAYPPWVIRSVCSHWRKVALEHRTLWNAIILQPNSYIQRGETRVIDWDRRLTRALSILPSETDVSIALRMNPHANYLVDDAFKKVVLPFAPRLGTLGIMGSGLRAFVNLFHMPSPTLFPSLNTLKLILDGFEAQPLRDYLLDGTVFDNSTVTEASSDRSLLSSAPNLRSFSIIWQTTKGFNEFFQGLRNQVCWAKLTHLRLKSIDFEPMKYDHLLPTLNAATNLRRLSLDVDFAKGFGGLSHALDTITLPHLQHLHVRSLTLPGIFDFLTLPSLQHLIIDAVEDKFLQSVFEMITRSSCSLVSFEERGTLSHLRWPTPFFIEFITRCGNLEELRTNREITTELLHKVVAQEMLGRCGFQRWNLPSDVSVEALTSTVTDGLERSKWVHSASSASGNGKSKHRILVLAANMSKQGEINRSFDSRFRIEYGLELRVSIDDLLPSDYIKDEVDEFDGDSRLFHRSHDLNFERDFAQWFNPDEGTNPVIW